jgi:glycerophosphoryl diester phosphodiesterase
MARGCDGFELDVRITRDGHAVLWHDPSWQGLPIADIDCGALADQNGNRPASLEEVLNDFGARAYLDIELKVTGIESNLVQSLRASPPRCGVLVSSFFPWILTALRTLDDALPLGFIFDHDEGLAGWHTLPVRVVLPQVNFVTHSLVEQVHESGRRIMAWTVNSADRMRELAGWGIDGIISDDPALLYQTFHPSR